MPDVAQKYPGLRSSVFLVQGCFLPELTQWQRIGKKGCLVAGQAGKIAIMHMKLPVNSQANDVYLFANDEGEQNQLWSDDISEVKFFSPRPAVAIAFRKVAPEQVHIEWHCCLQKSLVISNSH